MTAKSAPTPATESPLEQLLQAQDRPGIPEDPNDPVGQFKVSAKCRTLRRQGDSFVETRYFASGCTRITYTAEQATALFTNLETNQ